MSQHVIDLIAAARPNFMKVAPLYNALRSTNGRFLPRLVHTGQHYDDSMSGAFFRDLGLPEPDVHLGVGSGTHAEQTGGVMIAYEKQCRAVRPDWTVVVGDVNSTMACALAAKKLNVPVAHLEAGLRSGDRTMPEEINRLVTDAVADLLWTPSADADANLEREGIPKERIQRVGNIMIDALEMMRSRIEAHSFAGKLGLNERAFGVVTLHRPSNVDDPMRLAALVDMLSSVAARLPLVFPVHPRTRQRLQEFGHWQTLANAKGVILLEPAGYVEFMNLIFHCAAVITDSGGIQEETTYLGIPCITLRETTERPITVTEGTNRLMTVNEVLPAMERILRGKWPKGRRPELWDGKAAFRVVESMARAMT